MSGAKRAPSSSVLTYLRDYSLGGGFTTAATKRHASNPTRHGEAACSSDIILVLGEPKPLLETFERDLCRRAACRKIFDAQQRGRATRSDRRDGPPGADRRAQRRRRGDKLVSTLADVRRAKDAFDAHRTNQELNGFEVCLVVVGYVSGRDPFRLIGRVSADTGAEAMPDPPLTQTEMQPVAFAAKMALAKVLAARSKRR